MWQSCNTISAHLAEMWLGEDGQLTHYKVINGNTYSRTNWNCNDVQSTAKFFKQLAMCYFEQRTMWYFEQRAMWYFKQRAMRYFDQSATWFFDQWATRFSAHITNLG